jgi:ABC-type transport system involved in multi-copper enzyme maturation permease subunit
MNQTTLFRYNFRVLMLNNWWLLVFPLAVSQLTIYWNVLTQQYKPTLPSQSVEMVTPLLAAFLGAHLLSAEYRSRIGAVLASRPVNIGNIVVMRLVVMLALVWGLAFLSVQAYYFWMEPFDQGVMILACVPSTLFMTMLALTFATLFRNSLAGFGIAALYWALDLPSGAPLNPYLSLKSLTNYYMVLSNPERHTFVENWKIAKIILLVAALLLFFYHSRLVFTLGSPHTLRTRRRALVGAGCLLLFSLLSGAFLKVGYGYSHRGALPPDDVSWFRYQFTPYGPLPVAALLGPAFPRYLGELTNVWRLGEIEEADRMGDTAKHRKDLQYIRDRMSGSMWAPSAADALARIDGRKQATPEDTAAYYRYIVDHYPNSPYVAFALRQIARRFAEAERKDEARAAYTELLQRLPNNVYRTEAMKFLADNP